LNGRFRHFSSLAKLAYTTSLDLLPEGSTSLVDCSFYSAAGQISNDYLAAIRATFVSERDMKQDKKV
ncbi:hypothetical protein T07_7307, partial [Trichinella nelsoni]